MATTSVRRTRARSPFLLSAPTAESTDWWQEMCTSVGSWLTNNPLLLGIDEASFQLITSQIKRGNALNCSEDVRRKAWLHIDVEFEGVPGSPMEKFKAMAESAGLKSPSPGDSTSRLQLSKSSRKLSGKLQTLIDSSGADGLATGESANRENDQDVADALSTLMKSTSVRDTTAAILPSEFEEIEGDQSDTLEHVVEGVDAVNDTNAESNNRRMSQSSPRADTEVQEEFVDATTAQSTNSRKGRRTSLPAASTNRPGSNSKSDASKRRASMPKSRKSSIGNIVKTSSNIKRKKSKTTVKKGNTQTNLLDECRKTLTHSRGGSGSLEALEAQEGGGETPDLGVEDKTTGSTTELPAPLVFNTSQEGGEIETNDATNTTTATDTNNGTKREFKFRRNSTPQQGKVQLMDPILFNLDSFYRQRDRGTAAKGVTLLMGTLETTHKECVANVVFDLSKWTEEEASEWLNDNIARLQRAGIE